MLDTIKDILLFSNTGTADSPTWALALATAGAAVLILRRRIQRD